LLQKRIKALLDLFRFTLGILSSFAVLASGFIVFVLDGNTADFLTFIFDNGVLEWPGLVLGLLATMMLTWSIQSINDYYDVETDIANERFDRPLARGDLSRDFVRRLVIAMFSASVLIIIGLVVVYNVTVALLIFTLIFIAIGIGYNLGIKEKGFLGNIWVSSGYVAPIFMGFFMLNPQNSVSLFTCLLVINSAFFMSVGREIIKDIQDYEGDKHQNLNSLAIKYGPEKAGLIAIIFFFGTFSSSIIAGLFVYQNLVYWFLDFLFILTLVLTSYTIMTEKNLGGKKARKYTRWSLWIALGAFFFGIFHLPE
jgi:geranylgeranylglycerol-phosphate geranylgeranyltransferase